MSSSILQVSTVFALENCYNIVRGEDNERILHKILTNDKDIRYKERERVQQTNERPLNVICRKYEVHKWDKKI